MRKPYIRPIPASWWLKRRPYFWFMVRELTAVFVAAYGVFLLVMLWKLRSGPEAFADFLSILQSPLSIVLHIIALLFAIYHSITWFNLSPKVTVVRLGEEKVSPALVAGSNYVLWVILSIMLIWLILKR